MPFASMLDLPAELLAEITDFVAASRQDLRQLRCVNRTFHDLATPGVFKNLTVYTTVTNARGFLNLLDSPIVANHIQDITLVENSPLVPRTPGDKNLDHKKVRECIRAAFAALHRLPVLGSLTLFFEPITSEKESFPDICPPQDRSLLLQWHVLGALGCNPNPLPSLHSLTIEKLLPVPHPLFAKGPFRQIIASLRHLRFLTHVGDYNHNQDSRWKFWKEVVEQNLLLPAVNLESLSMTCGMGSAPPIDYNLLAYPRLTALSLGNIIWVIRVAPSGSTKGEMLPEVENFVVRHGKTLKKLELRNCAMAVLRDSTVRRSGAAIWTRFANELTKLVDLVLYKPWNAGTDDVLALGTFKTIVEARKSN